MLGVMVVEPVGDSSSEALAFAELDGWGEDADIRRVGNGGRRSRLCLWGGYGFEWRWLMNLTLEISVGKSPEYGEGRCVRRVWFAGRKFRRGGQTLPATLPQFKHILEIQFNA